MTTTDTAPLGPPPEVPSVGVPALMEETLGALVEGIVVLQRMSASVAAMTAELVDRARQWSETTELAGGDGPQAWGPVERARRSLVAELACAMRMPETTVANLVAESEMLVHELPETFAALSEGRISWRHAQKLVEHATSLRPEARAGFEEAVLPHAERLTVSRLGSTARKLRERMHPESIDARHRVAADQRSVEVAPAADGMAWLTAHLPAATAHGIHDRLTRIADEWLRAGGDVGDDRTAAQVRADVFADLLLDPHRGTGHADAGRVDGGHIRAQVLITVPALTLLGRSDEPAVLEGYGPIDHDTARRLAGRASSWMRILTHPETGALLSLGRTKYRVTDDLRMFLRVRDETCRFPGCGRAARRSDIDHTRGWADGSSTDHVNLAHLCRKHHRLKHQTPWRVEQESGGTLRWASPTGRHYTTEPAVRLGG